MPELTKQEYDNIIDRIINRKVEPPKGKCYAELNAWLQGYTDCQNDIIDIIDSLKNHFGR